MTPAQAFRGFREAQSRFRNLAVTGGLQRRCMTEGVAAIVQRDKAVAFGRVEPLHLARRGSLREGPGPTVVVLCHWNRRHTLAG